MTYAYPGGDLDRPDALLALLGSLWSEVYAGGDLVRDVVAARARLDAQAHADLLELVAAVSRLTVPVFHREEWYRLTLRESARGAADAPRYGGRLAYATPAQASYGVAAGRTASWALPAGLVEVPVVLNRITDAGLAWTCGVDYTVDRDRGLITFRQDPFASDLVPVREVFEDNAVVDREAALWVYRGSFDRNTVFLQFGYVLGRPLPSSEAYRGLLNGVFDGLVQGTTVKAVQDALAALCDVPLAREPAETVEAVFRDNRALWVATDAHAYRFHRDAAALVAPGDVVHAGDPLSDALRIYELTSGATPPAAALPALAMGRGLLAAGYYQDVVFANVTVPLEVTEAPDGFTRVEFALGGFPGDVAKFWDDVHAAGVAAGQTLAMLMDQRPPGSRAGQPTALALPATVNPLQFLVQNLLRAHLTVAVVRPGRFGPDALGLANARLLRKVVPPHTALVLVATLAIPAEIVTMEGPGNAAAPGYEDTVSTFLGTGVAETLDPATAVGETVRLRQVRGRCI